MNRKNDLKEAYKVCQDEHIIKPVDVYENPVPTKWKIDGEMIEYDW